MQAANQYPMTISPAKLAPSTLPAKQMTFSHITHRYVVHDTEQEVFGCAFSKDSSLLAASYADGSIGVYSSMVGDQLYNLKDFKMTYPITDICWKPFGAQQFIGVGADGSVITWRPKLGNRFETILQSEDNAFQCLDICPLGDTYALAGKLSKIEIMDEATNTKVSELCKSAIGRGGHTNRIFALKYFHSNPHLLMSGGWDSNVNVWDVRTQGTVAVLGGPQICGKAIDVRNDGNTILTGSYRVKQGLQLWDLRMQQVTSQVQWTDSKNPDDHTLLYTAQFSNPHKDLIIAGGADKNVCKVFKFQTLDTVAVFAGMTKPVLTADTSSDSSLLAIGTANGSVHLKNLIYV